MQKSDKLDEKRLSCCEPSLVVRFAFLRRLSPLLLIDYVPDAFSLPLLWTFSRFKICVCGGVTEKKAGEKRNVFSHFFNTNNSLIPLLLPALKITI